MSETTSTRRHFIRKAAELSIFAGTLNHAAAETWSNWSGGQRSHARAILYPSSEADISNIIHRTQGTLRVVGGGHSFSPLVPTDGTIMSLEAMNGLKSHDDTHEQATFWAGTRIASASPALSTIGQGFYNEADINMQSLAGAICTATHGTGRQLSCLSSYVTELRLITAQGDTIDCSADRNSELFQAARVSLGALGIITRITTRNRPAYKLKEVVKVMNLNDAMAWVDSHKDRYAHIEFMGFPLGDRAIVKTLEETQEADTPAVPPYIDENKLLDLAANTVRHFPWTNTGLQKLIGLFVSDSTRVGPSWAIYPSVRAVPFNEMEYELPVEHGLEACQEIIATMRRERMVVFFPLEFRYVAADDCWLSPFYRRPSVAISVHQYYRQDYHPAFRILEPIFWKYQGRPHWGKLNTLGPRQCHELYPHFADFIRVQQHVDPQGRMLNNYLRHLLQA